MKPQESSSRNAIGDPDPAQGSADDSLTPSGQTATAKARFRRHTAPFIAVILILLLYLPTLIWLVRSWLHNSYYSHGFLIPLVSLIIAWGKRGALKREEPSGGAFLVLAVGLAAYVAGFAWSIRSLSAISFIFVLAGLVWAFYGFKAVRAMVFPIGFLMFMIPFPFFNEVAFRLQYVSIHSCTWLLHALGLHITTIGSEITLGETTFAIGLPCSGLNTLVALVSLAAVFAYLLDGPAYKRVIIFALSFPVAVLANALRIVSIILIAHYYNVGFATGFYHDISSLIFFMLAFLGLILISWMAGCRLRIRRQKDEPWN